MSSWPPLTHQDVQDEINLKVNNTDGFIPAIPAWNITPQRQAGIRRALSYLPYGSVHVGGKIACLGDSTTQGYGAPTGNEANVGSYPNQLAQILTGAGASAVRGLAIPAFGSAAVDSRWTVGAGWAQYTTQGIGWANKSNYYAPNGTTANLSFATQGVVGDRVDVYYFASSGNGSFQVNVDGGTDTTVNTNNGGAGVWAKTTLTVTNIPHTVNIHNVTTGNVYIVGVDVYDSTSGALRIANLGTGGAKASDYTSNTLATGFATTEGLKLYAPDLTIIGLGINDAGASVSSSAFYADLLTIVTAAQVSGDVILLSPIPSDNARYPTSLSGETTYAGAMLAFAQAHNCGYVDLFSRYGDYASIAALGFNQGDGLHLSGYGYVDMARAVAAALPDASAVPPSDSAWTNATLVNSWTNYATGYPNASYRRSVSKWVTLRGQVQGGATFSVITTLPVGYRPSAKQQFAVSHQGTTLGRVEVGPDGTVTYLNGATLPLELSSVAFLAEL